MKENNPIKNYKIYLGFFVALVVMMYFYPNEGNFKYDYQKGKAWIYETLITPIDFPLLKSNEELLLEKEQISSEVIPYYNFNKQIAYQQYIEANKLNADTTLNQGIVRSTISTVKKIYKKGVLASSELVGEGNKTIIVQMDKRALQLPASEVYDLKSGVTMLYSTLMTLYPNFNIDSIFVEKKFRDLIVPNLQYDQKKTEMLHRNAVDFISPTKGIIYTGQLIVSEGEIITAEIAQLLDSYKVEYERSFGYSGSKWSIFISHFFISLLILFFLYATIFLLYPKTFKSLKRVNFLLLLFIISFVVTAFVTKWDSSMVYLIPYPVFALYLLSFFRKSFTLPIYAVLLVPVLILVENGVEIYFMNMFAGIFSILLFNYLNLGWLQFLNAFLIFISMLFSYSIFRLLTDGSFTFFSTDVIFYLVCNALFVIGVYPLVFLMEKVFGFVSTSRLRDLSDTNGKLLQEMAIKAPGTFQHCLQVSNMAQDAVRVLGGDVMLTKVGALFHDIGKINNPQCFVENKAAGMDYHKDLTPIESAEQIIKHVTDGMEIAKKHSLPKAVAAFIITHHAQTKTGYFYNTYCNNGGDPNNVEPFTYKGELPWTKEHVVVLMADAIEAASRTLEDYSKESISKLVDGIISSRLSDSQLAKADISIREINLVKDLFKEYLQHVYHSRIVYPDKK